MSETVRRITLSEYDLKKIALLAMQGERSLTIYVSGDEVHIINPQPMAHALRWVGTKARASRTAQRWVEAGGMADD